MCSARRASFSAALSVRFSFSFSLDAASFLASSRWRARFARAASASFNSAKVSLKSSSWRSRRRSTRAARFASTTRRFAASSFS